MVATASVGLALAACGSTPFTLRSGQTTLPSGETPSSTPATTMATNPFVTTLPVVSCPTTFGAGSRQPFVASQLPAEVGTGGLSFYSNGLLTVLAPAGWSCRALVAADGGQRLDAYPSSESGPILTGTPAGTEVVQVEGEWTGHGPGALLICPLFPASPAATFMQNNPPCPQPPAGEARSPITADVVGFRDPPGTRGTGAGSGGSLASQGAGVYPQVGNREPAGGVDVFVLSCTLEADTARLCPAIQVDFLVRYAPSYGGASA